MKGSIGMDGNADYQYTFTVFTPTYNRAHTLSRVYWSLCEQSFRDFEWLIVDDGSTDDTGDLVSRWRSEAQFPIRYIRQGNRGKHMATNLGVREARGSLFLELDSDDSCVPQALERFAYHWWSIPEQVRSNFSGVTALCQDGQGGIVGDSFPSDVLDSNSLEVRYRYKVRGEKWGFQRTEVLRRFPFPVTEEAIYVPEGIVWSKVARQYRTRFVNEPLRVYWAEGHGVHDQLTKARPVGPESLGYVMWHRSVLATESDWFRNSPTEFARSAVHYTRFCLHCGIGFRQQARSLGNRVGASLWLAMLPVGCAAYALDVAKSSGKRVARIVRAQDKPGKFILSRLLMRSRLSWLVVIHRDGYTVRFYPSSVNAALWVDPSQRCNDEKIFRRYLREGDVVVDVGANVGTLALTAASVVGPRGRVHAVEPHPRICSYLRRNVKRNKAYNVVLHNVALGAEDGTTCLSDYRGDDQNCIRPTGRIPVPIRRLDSLKIPGGPIALLKLDVEGFERFVVEGGRNTLGRVEVVFFESWDLQFKHFGYDSKVLFDMLVGCGFQLFRVGTGGTLVPLPEGYRSSELENLVAVRNVAEFVTRTGFVLSVEDSESR
jgi:FkbM family methyltransferase